MKNKNRVLVGMKVEVKTDWNVIGPSWENIEVAEDAMMEGVEEIERLVRKAFKQKFGRALKVTYDFL